MGTDKALLPFGDECLLEYMVHKYSPHFDKIYLSVNKRGDYGHLDLDTTEIPDIYLNAGPMGAILSSLTMILEDRAFFVSIDTPFLQPTLALHLLQASQNYDACAMKLRDHYVDIIATVYSKACIPAFGTSILLNITTNSQINGKCYTNYVPLDEVRTWSNTPLEKQLYRLSDRDSYYYALLAMLKEEEIMP
jgi:molybdopterin-guanine dinucleotide biosynthesis protein A